MIPSTKSHPQGNPSRTVNAAASFATASNVSKKPRNRTSASTPASGSTSMPTPAIVERPPQTSVIQKPLQV